MLHGRAEEVPRRGNYEIPAFVDDHHFVAWFFKHSVTSHVRRLVRCLAKSGEERLLRPGCRHQLSRQPTINTQRSCHYRYMHRCTCADTRDATRICQIAFYLIATQRRKEKLFFSEMPSEIVL